MKNAYYSYDITKMINVVLFIIQSFGNKIHLLLLNKLLYTADIMHLSRYGYFITRDRYILMKTGLVPANSYFLYLQLIEDNSWLTLRYNVREFFFIKGNYICCHQKYDGDVLSASEVSCLFEAIRIYKQEGAVFLSKPPAYNMLAANPVFNELTILDVAKAIGLSNEMYRYIFTCVGAELFGMDDDNTSKLNSKKISILSAVSVGTVIREHHSGYLNIIVGISPAQYSFLKIFDAENLSHKDFYKDLSASFYTFKEQYSFLKGTEWVNCSQLHAISHDGLYQWLKAHPEHILGGASAGDVGIIHSLLHHSPTIPLKAKEELLVNI